MKILDLKETIYTDQTGQFPFTSSKGNRYVMVAIHVGASYIFITDEEQNKWSHGGNILEDPWQDNSCRIGS